MAKEEVKVGETFGTWTIMRESHRDSSGRKRWMLRCDCGNERIVFDQHVRATGKCHVCSDGPVPSHLRN